jgi:hypothetical protein
MLPGPLIPTVSAGSGRDTPGLQQGFAGPPESA